MPAHDPAPPVDRLRKPKQDSPSWQDQEGLSPRPSWMPRRPGGEDGAAVPAPTPIPSSPAGSAERPEQGKRFG